MKRFWFPLAICFCSAMTCTLCTDQAEEEAAIRKIDDAYVEAYNKHDAKALAAMWSPEAVYVDPETSEEAGRARRDREGIRRHVRRPEGRQTGNRCRGNQVSITQRRRSKTAPLAYSGRMKSQMSRPTSHCS